MMGARGYNADEEPVHEVEITQDFYLGIFLVTKSQLCACPLHQGREFGKYIDEYDKEPVENMTWHDARAYGRWVSELADVPAAHHARLPTESEWEYACGAWHYASCGRVYTEYHAGDGYGALALAGWYRDVENGIILTHAQHVGQLAPNQFGLYDMHGNLAEWCLDYYNPEQYRTAGFLSLDPFVADEVGSSIHPRQLSTQVDDISSRVVRGGTWIDSAFSCRAAYRTGATAGGRDSARGFRIGLFPDPIEPEPKS